MTDPTRPVGDRPGEPRQGRRGVDVPVIGRRRPAAPGVRRRARAVVSVVVVLAVAASPARSWPCGRRPRVRRSTARRPPTQRDVDAMLHGVATIEPVTQAAVAFPVGGTVATVGGDAGRRPSTAGQTAGHARHDRPRGQPPPAAGRARPGQPRPSQKALDGESVAAHGATPLVHAGPAA